MASTHNRSVWSQLMQSAKQMAGFLLFRAYTCKMQVTDRELDSGRSTGQFVPFTDSAAHIFPGNVSVYYRVHY